MAKQALKNKQQRQPKFRVRGYTRCQRCGVPRRLQAVPAVPHLLPSPGARRRAAGGDEGVMVTKERQFSSNVNDPVADLLTRIRNANLAYKDDLAVPVSR